MTTKVCAIGLAMLAGASSAQDTVFAVTQNQTLLSWNASSPDAVLTGVAIQGLMANETLHGIDFRPATGDLYGLGSFSNLYRIDAATGIAQRVGSGFSGAGTTLSGTSFGFDFNPVIDRIRVVSDTDQNLVLNPDTGGASRVTDLFYQSGDANENINPNIVGSAYTNNFAGATSTQLYGVDTALDVLVTQANSAGTLGTVGPLGFDVNATLSFDISGATGIGYMTVQDFSRARSTFWTVDLATGAASMVGEIGGGALVTAMAVVPTPATCAVLTLPAAGLLRRRR